jgi:hypothetical protein
VQRSREVESLAVLVDDPVVRALVLVVCQNASDDTLFLVMNTYYYKIVWNTIATMLDNIYIRPYISRVVGHVPCLRTRFKTYIQLIF